jgi:hypothetical protein
MGEIEEQFGSIQESTRKIKEDCCLNVTACADTTLAKLSARGNFSKAQLPSLILTLTPFSG